MYYTQSVNIYSPQAVYTTFRTQESAINVASDKISLICTDEQTKMLQDSSTTLYSWISEIEQTAHEISLSVEKKTEAGEIISSINVYPGTVKINSDKIELDGYVTFKSLSDDDGETVINGDNIRTGKLIITSDWDSANGISVIRNDFFNDNVEIIRIDDDGFAIKDPRYNCYVKLADQFFGGVAVSWNEDYTGATSIISSGYARFIEDNSEGIDVFGNNMTGAFAVKNSTLINYDGISIRATNTDLFEVGSAGITAIGTQISFNYFGTEGSITADKIFAISHLQSNGTKSRKVSTEDYSDRLLYCYETPSPLFGDVGCGIIAEDGYCYIQIDPVFSETIETTEYQVFLQNYGDGSCYVYARYPSYFIVCGTPNMEFGWEMKAHQIDFESIRLEQPIEDVDQETADYGEEAYVYLKQLENERNGTTND